MGKFALGVLVVCMVICTFAVAISPPAVATQKSPDYQQFVDEYTGEVCLGGIVYFFGVQGNRSWMSPKIDAKAHNTYINCGS